MPGPNIRNAVLEKKTAPTTARQVYYLTDPTCQEIHGIPVTDQMRESGIVLTASEAMTLIASGAVSTDKAHAEAAAETQTAGVAAMREARAAVVKSQEAEAQASMDAALHNTGQRIMTGDQVDAIMGTKPDNKPVEAEPKPSAAASGDPKPPPADAVAPGAADPIPSGSATAETSAPVSAEEHPPGWAASQSGAAAGAGLPQS